MKKLLIFLSVLCILSPALLHAQKGEVMSDFATQVSQHGSKYSHTDISCMLSYNFSSKIYGGLKIEDALAMTEIDGIKDHHKNFTIGTTWGVRMFKLDENLNVDLRAGLGTTVGGEDWKYIYYDGGLFLNRRYGCVVPSVGFGVRYYDSYNKANDSRLRGYVSLGFAFIW